MLSLVDIAACAEIARRHGALLVVDNTFATPYLQKPIELGATRVVHSTTKYLGGHSDVSADVVVNDDPTYLGGLRFRAERARGGAGAVRRLARAARRLKTLAVRMRQHATNARAVVAFLRGSPRRDRRALPRPRRIIRATRSRARQMRGFGGMVTIELESEARGRRARSANRTKLFTLGESLGGVESLIEHPFRMTHAATANGPFASPRNLVRLSAGIESADDLIEDLAQALVPVRSSSSA